MEDDRKDEGEKSSLNIVYPGRKRSSLINFKSQILDFVKVNKTDRKTNLSIN